MKLQKDTKLIRVKSIEHLQELVTDKVGSFRLALTGCYSRKLIEYDTDEQRFRIEHLIDGAEESFTRRQLEKDKRIAAAIKKGNFFFEGVEHDCLV